MSKGLGVFVGIVFLQGLNAVVYAQETPLNRTVAMEYRHKLFIFLEPTPDTLALHSGWELDSLEPQATRLQQAQAYYERKLYGSALALLEAINASSSGVIHQKAALLRLRCLYDLKQFDAVVDEGQQFVQAYPDSVCKADVLFLVGQAYLKCSKYQEAEALFHTILTGASKETEYKTRLGLVQVYDKTGRLAQAIEQLQILIDQSQNSEAIERLTIRQSLYEMMLRRYEQALSGFEKLLRRDRTSLEPEVTAYMLYQKAFCEYKTERFSEAKSTLEHLLQTYPNAWYGKDFLEFISNYLAKKAAY